MAFILHSAQSDKGASIWRRVCVIMMKGKEMKQKIRKDKRTKTHFGSVKVNKKGVPGK